MQPKEVSTGVRMCVCVFVCVRRCVEKARLVGKKRNEQAESENAQVGGVECSYMPERAQESARQSGWKRARKERKEGE